MDQEPNHPDQPAALEHPPSHGTPPGQPDGRPSPDGKPAPPNGQPPRPRVSEEPRKRRSWGVWIVVLLVVGAGAFYLLTRNSGKQGAGTQGKGGAGAAGRRGAGAVPVAVAQVKKGNINEYINALGIVTPIYTVTVTSRVTGQLMSIYYKEGEIVQKGALLAEIDARPYLAALTQAQGQLARDQALLHNARIDLERYQQAFSQHAIPEQTLATQQSTVTQDEGTVKLDEGNLQAAQVNADYAKITAPITGRVGLRTVDPGNIVQANGSVGLSITQLQPITVIFAMAEDYISDVAPQMRAGKTLRVDALDRSQQNLIATGKVLTIDNQIDTTTGTVKVRATFGNESLKLFPNEFVNARLLDKTLFGVNVIPTAAIQRNQDQAYVWIKNANNTVRSRNISVATTEGENSAVTGVVPGDVVVIDGFDRLVDGSNVVVRQPATTGKNPTASGATAQGVTGSNMTGTGTNGAQTNGAGVNGSTNGPRAPHTRAGQANPTTQPAPQNQQQQNQKHRRNQSNQ